MIGITFTRYKYLGSEGRDIETSVQFGPFDWIEVEVPVINAEANSGENRWEHLAVLHTPVGDYHWKTKDGQRWHDFVVAGWQETDTPNYPK